MLEQGLLISGTVPRVIRILPGGLCHFWQPPAPRRVLRTQEEDRKPPWVDDMPLLCVLGRLFNSFHVMTCPSRGGNEVIPAGGNVGLESKGRAEAESSKRQDSQECAKEQKWGRGPSVWASPFLGLGAEAQHPGKKMQCSDTCPQGLALPSASASRRREDVLARGLLCLPAGDPDTYCSHFSSFLGAPAQRWSHALSP